MADPHADYLRQRWDEGCRNASQLWREVRAHGYAGHVNGLRAWVAEHLRGGAARTRTAGVAKPVWQPPTPRRTARLLTMDPDLVRGNDRSFLDALTAASPEIVQAAALARRFQVMVKAQTVEALAPWLADARRSPLAGFAQCLERDRAAIEAALTTP